MARHPLIKLRAIQTHEHFVHIGQILTELGLSVGKARRLNNSQADQVELYEFGHKEISRLVWGWIQRSDLGIILKIFFEVGQSRVFLMFQQNNGQWIVGVDPEPERLRPEVRWLWGLINEINEDSELIEGPKVFLAVKALATFFKTHNAQRRLVS